MYTWCEIQCRQGKKYTKEKVKRLKKQCITVKEGYKVGTLLTFFFHFRNKLTQIKLPQMFGSLMQNFDTVNSSYNVYDDSSKTMISKDFQE